MKQLTFLYHVCDNLIYVDFVAYRHLRRNFDLERTQSVPSPSKDDPDAPWPIP